MNLSEYDISQPYQAQVVRSERITAEESGVEVRHIVLDVPDSTFQYVEGQSVGVLAPGSPQFGNPVHFRLYSIASARQGENGDMSQISLCVRRCFYVDDVSGEQYPGVASNYLCDRQPGDVIQLSGPYGRQFTVPRDPNANLLMIGIGTGIAPFRAFIKHIYDERHNWQGKVRLFYGAQTGTELLYMNDVKNDIGQYYNDKTFLAFEALSPRPHFDEPADLGARLEENRAEIWELLQDPQTHVYVAGLESLREMLDAAMVKVAGSEAAWRATKDQLESDGRWSELLYS
jgi:ferredoxin--NADP+ reductase